MLYFQNVMAFKKLSVSENVAFLKGNKGLTDTRKLILQKSVKDIFPLTEIKKRLIYVGFVHRMVKTGVTRLGRFKI